MMISHCQGAITPLLASFPDTGSTPAATRHPHLHEQLLDGIGCLVQGFWG